MRIGDWSSDVCSSDLKGALEPDGDERLAGPGARRCDQQPRRRLAGQNSMPRCAFTPDRNGCFTCTISVTRSAASISASGALRPVTMTCFIALRRSEEHTSELQSLMRISYAVFCLKKKNIKRYKKVTHINEK